MLELADDPPSLKLRKGHASEAKCSQNGEQYE